LKEQIAMSTVVKLPALGENVTGGTVTKVMVKPGDVIAKDQPILEMETDKAVMEVPSPDGGRVAEVSVKAGEKISVGQVILTLAAEEAPPAVSSADAPAIQPEARAPAPPASVEPVSTQRAAALEQAAAKVAGEPAPTSAPATGAAASLPVAAAPSVRRFAREIGIDIHEVPGSGPGGRISIEDVKAYAKRLNERAKAGRAIPSSAAPAALPDFSKWGPVERQGLSTVRAKIAEHMAVAWSQIPHVTQFDWADITDIEERRKRLAPKAEKAGAKLTITAILIKIVAAALKNFPKFNASLDMARGEIILKRYYNIGVAVDTDRGLLVPVIRQADQKNIIQIALDLSQLAEKARSGKISLEDLQGGTFTVTNLGGIGGTHFTPIVNYPEVAILGVGRAKREPSFREKEGCCSPRLMLPLSLSYDHRLIDGADGARFLRWIVDAIEEPLLIPLEG
jgi:pyruvate dehydrogenase E2 component (dihydrolipoamide acetyltransferase)